MTRMLAWYPTLDSTIDGTPSPPRQAERGAPFSLRLMKTPRRATLSPKGARAEDLVRTLRKMECELVPSFDCERTCVEIIRFAFWEAVKVLALVLLTLVCVKSVATLRLRRTWMKLALNALVIIFAGLGAWYAGNDVAAQVYMWSSQSSIGRDDLVKAYSNAM